MILLEWVRSYDGAMNLWIQSMNSRNLKSNPEAYRSWRVTAIQKYSEAIQKIHTSEQKPPRSGELWNREGCWNSMILNQYSLFGGQRNKAKTKRPPQSICKCKQRARPKLVAATKGSNLVLISRTSSSLPQVSYSELQWVTVSQFRVTGKSRAYLESVEVCCDLLKSIGVGWNPSNSIGVSIQVDWSLLEPLGIC